MPILRRTGPWTGTSIYASRRRDRAPFLERIFLHVGLEKTGTTTLQAAMAVNRQLLRRYGYVFPEGLDSFPSYHIGLTLWAANPDAVSELRHAAGLTSRKAYDAFLQSYPSQIARELARSGGHTAILSNEHCSSRLATVAEIKNPSNHRAVGSQMPSDHLPEASRRTGRESLFYCRQIGSDSRI
jgi:hypothetical protein